MARAIRFDAIEASLKRRLRRHLKRLGFGKDSIGQLSLPGETKDTYRRMHLAQRAERLLHERSFLRSKTSQLIEHFASGSEVVPESIEPSLVLVESKTEESDLFRFASLTWSVPVSQGYGRRMRFLLRDNSNGKLIGIMALGDPVFNLKARDDLIGWDHRVRVKKLANVMDAYVLGAVPPYNTLLCGKLLASLVRTKEMRSIFAERYGDSRGILSRKKKRPVLALVTTSSALGRSSIYNRLKLGGQDIFVPIGYTSGWGHFHIPGELFDDMRSYLKARNHPYADGHKYGGGPNWRLRAIRAALQLIGIDQDVMKHGIKREVFACKLASNAERYLRGDVGRPYFRQLKSVAEVSRLALERWVIPRAQRRPEFRNWSREQVLNLLRPQAAVQPPQAGREIDSEEAGLDQG